MPKQINITRSERYLQSFVGVFLLELREIKYLQSSAVDIYIYSPTETIIIRRHRQFWLNFDFPDILSKHSAHTRARICHFLKMVVLDSSDLKLCISNENSKYNFFGCKDLAKLYKISGNKVSC